MTGLLAETQGSSESHDKSQKACISGLYPSSYKSTGMTFPYPNHFLKALPLNTMVD